MTSTSLGLEVHVAGDPVAQGSKKAFVRKGKAVLVEASPELPRWRTAIITAAQARARTTGWVTLTDACRVSMTFRFTRPKSVTRRWPCVAPDEDKLVRAVFDALTQAAVFHDDALVVAHDARTVYADDGRGPGVIIRVTPMQEGMF